jgi:hypothetical protein
MGDSAGFLGLAPTLSEGWVLEACESRTWTRVPLRPTEKDTVMLHSTVIRHGLISVSLAGAVAAASLGLAGTASAAEQHPMILAAQSSPLTTPDSLYPTFCLFGHQKGHKGCRGGSVYKDEVQSVTGLDGNTIDNIGGQYIKCEEGAAVGGAVGAGSGLVAGSEYGMAAGPDGLAAGAAGGTAGGAVTGGAVGCGRALAGQ